MKKFLRAFCVLTLLIGVGTPGTSAGSGPDPASESLAPAMIGKKVLVVHSYHREHPWVVNVEAGVRAALGSSGVRMKSVYMDTKRNPGEEYKKQAGHEAHRAVERFRPEVVIASDDNAQQYFAGRYAGRAGAPQIVFCAVNSDPAAYGYPAVNVTGIEERIFFARSVQFLQKIVPGVRSMLVLSDNSPSSLAALWEMRSQHADLDRIVWKSCGTFSKWKEALLTGQKVVDGVALLNYHVLRDQNGNQLDPQEVMAWTAGKLTRPSIGFHIFTVADGALCGIAQSGFEHGFRSGSMALNLLKKEMTAGDITIETDLNGVAMINKTAGHRIGVSVSAEAELLADGVIE